MCRHPMTFKEKLLNTVLTYTIHFIRNYLYIHDFENVIDKHFPEYPRDSRCIHILTTYKSSR